ncbi:Na+/H+ antiporter subunit G [Pueribacillus theae]|uniref:Na+/H+ antiporter subunit G n=1 Tax=Pueribacillus theae TaxID=2171751 RepID=A0A2U1K686_9BACI|nr:Na+/H+ antiporter subunit G [Pueribacillus theae]
MITIFLAIGIVFTVVAAIGVIRFPNVYSRIHAASKSATLGVLNLLLATFLYFWLIEGHFNSRLLLGIAFLFITAPIGGHIIARAAYMSGVKLSKKAVQDDLAAVVKARQMMGPKNHKAD